MNSLQSILRERSSALCGLLRHAAQLKDLDEQLGRQLPAPLNQHVMVANVHQDTLVLNTGSPVWASRLRYLTPAILEFARGRPGLETLRSVRVRVSLPETVAATDRRRSPQRPSRASAEHLRLVAETTADPAVRSALLRLAGHQHRRR